MALDAGTRSQDDMPSDRRRSRASSTATAATGIRRRRSATTPRRSIRISVPPALDCVASGELRAGIPDVIAAPAKDAGAEPRSSTSSRRRSRCAISRSSSAGSRARKPRPIAFPPRRGPTVRRRVPLVGPSYSSLNLSVEANPRQVQRGRELARARRRHRAVLSSRSSATSPYSSFTVALVESDLPGGHSPGYFAALNQPLPTSPLVWRNDPAAFSSFPDFFLAHELAHQWWGQAVGWRNYHEQWLSEGLRAVLRRALRAAAARRRRVRVACCASCASGAWTTRIRVRSTSATGSATSATRAASSARWSTTRARRCCTCCGAWSATSRSSAACGASTATSRFHKAGTEELRAAMETRDRAVARALLRALDLRLDAAAAEGRLSRRRAPTSCCRSSRSARCSTCR